MATTEDGHDDGPRLLLEAGLILECLHHQAKVATLAAYLVIHAGGRSLLARSVVGTATSPTVPAPPVRLRTSARTATAGSAARGAATNVAHRAALIHAVVVAWGWWVSLGSVAARALLSDAMDER